jgi:serine/threonine protein kinase/alpha-tubulin suppressor-like RCC1 family protein
VSAEHRDELPRFAELDAEYEVVRELGRGGTAVVYLARERELGREVAIKVVRATYIEDAEAAARLLREARTIAGLRHPNIVTLYGTRRLRDGSLALIMQYIHGRTLKHHIQQRGPLPVGEVERILVELGSALAYVQNRRMLHRDIKPENVYLDEETGRACLSDFGIARVWDDCGLTLPGTAIGTPAYMSPEQVDGGELDARSDIYSLGVVAHEMLTGRAPWAGESLFRMIYKQKHEDLPALSELRPDTPPRLRHVIERALRKVPAERFANADEFLAALTDDRLSWLERGQEPAQASSVASIATQSSPEESVTIRYRRSEQPPAETAVTAGRSKPQAITSGPPEQPGRRRNVVATVILVGLLVSAPVLVLVGRNAERRNESAQMSEPPPAPAAPVQAAQKPTGAEAVANATPAVAFAIFGSAQDGVAGDTLATPLVLRVEDADGRVVAGASVSFRVTTGRGNVEPATVLTDEHGLATAMWLPEAPGLHEAEAVIAGAKPVTFRARVSARPAVRLTSASTTERRRESGPGETSVISVRAEDDRGEPVAGAEVRFAVRSGGGRLEKASAITGRDGTARVKWTLGAGSSAQEAIAMLPEREDEAVSFRETVTSRLAVRARIAAGGTHTCAVQPDGGVWCWGGNDSGQLGAGSNSRRLAPVRVALREPIAKLSAGISHTCGVSLSGNAFCWGANDAGQLGEGTQVGRAKPVQVTTDLVFTDVFTGAAHSCGLDPRGRLYCWGQNTHGQLGDGTRTNRSAPVRVGGSRSFVSAAVGWAHSCGLASDGKAYCWGRNASGELGDGSSTTRPYLAAVAGQHMFTALAAGSGHTCGLSTAGTILCWGQNAHGQLGDGSKAQSPVPVAVAASVAFGQLTVGGLHSCGLSRAGDAFCWGRNNYGQLGDGTTQDRSRPVAVEGGIRFGSIQANGAHTCGTVAGAATGYCWGFNLSGQLGNGTRSNQSRPVAAGRPR